MTERKGDVVTFGSWFPVCDAILKHNVRWIELAAASPILNCIICYYVEGDRGHLLDERALQRKQPMNVRGNSRWQPGTCTGDLNLLLAIVKNIVGNTLVLSTSIMKAGSDSISKVSQKLDRAEKTKPFSN